jgi:hypothetical protein
MKRMAIILLIGYSLILGVDVRADGNGGLGGSYMRMGLGARSLALGNASVADEANGYAFYYNPALNGFNKGKIVSLSYSFMSLDRRFNFIGFSMHIEPDAGFALGWINSGVDNIPSYNMIGDPGEDINHSANGVYFSFARRFMDRLALGLSIKYFHERLGLDGDDYAASGLGLDLGAVYHINKDLALAAAVRDISSKLKANTDKLFEHGGTTIARFPVLYEVGARYTTPLQWLSAAYNFETSNKSDQRHHIGLEAAYKDRLALRFGLNDGQFTAGAGMRFDMFKLKGYLDYAFLPSVIDEGSSHVFSWQICFD